MCCVYFLRCEIDCVRVCVLVCVCARVSTCVCTCVQALLGLNLFCLFVVVVFLFVFWQNACRFLLRFCCCCASCWICRAVTLFDASVVFCCVFGPGGAHPWSCAFLFVLLLFLFILFLAKCMPIFVAVLLLFCVVLDLPRCTMFDAGAVFCGVFVPGRAHPWSCAFLFVLLLSFVCFFFREMASSLRPQSPLTPLRALSRPPRACTSARRVKQKKTEKKKEPLHGKRVEKESQQIKQQQN